MRWMAVIILGLVLPISALAGDDARQAKVDAATQNALSGMMADVARQPITPKLAVRDLLNSTNGADALMDTLKQADQIGGPRWIDEQTCQVQLEIAGQKVADRLVKISTAAGERSPVKAQTVRSAVRNWGRRTFTAVGSSATEVNAGAVERDH